MPAHEHSAAPPIVLRHSSDTEPGLTRKRMGRYWAYFDSEGNRITDREEIDRLSAIGLPPAYE
jgi:DNA topoisomerase I